MAKCDQLTKGLIISQNHQTAYIVSYVQNMSYFPVVQTKTKKYRSPIYFYPAK